MNSFPCDLFLFLLFFFNVAIVLKKYTFERFHVRSIFKRSQVKCQLCGRSIHTFVKSVSLMSTKSGMDICGASWLGGSVRDLQARDRRFDSRLS